MQRRSTVICRCEEVTLEQLEAAYASGCRTSRQLKMKTRAAMGACQGRVCRNLLETWIHAKDPESSRDAELLACRPPIRPVTFGQLARGGE
ncbi:(2Fe-2S)-binding protein [Paenibacillus macerans]|uniref:(2Fe-2S)-binding protein n=1 Tax=Paenibacillus macerans TaxID=44252 RepID=A0A091A303_PAEMA|nr:(2Fe-2S)-binding protein [Paenibacillus macerans]KFN10671.1 BFD-like [2Fe-2S] binding domain protein [Paenibacillus macerans]MBS5912040.1 (2Fe-2S)-binding protein [Paenibacillus macerans]MCY7561770.1 (2Fe-2S)-binding protein [Paenibacillus macerans]MDU5951036.1 (2Fe-2S)-binding protein [Paenibacillus macerans]MEC0139009.1 (2Fe-2S)-binding protein [Paenibacillus macerans]